MKTVGQTLKAIIPFAITAVFLYFAFYNVDIDHFWNALIGTDLVLIILLSAMAVLSIVIRSWRWQVLLSPVKQISFTSVFNFNMIGFMANNVLPARVGEIVRPYLLARKEKIDSFSAFSTIVVERLFDGIALVILLLFILLLIPVQPVFLYVGALVGGASIALMVLLALLATDRFSLRDRIVRLTGFLPARFQESAVTRANRFFLGLNILKSWRSIVALLALSLLIWLQMASIIYTVLLFFPFADPAPSNLMLASVVVIVFLAFGVALPSSPGYVGITQVVFKLGLAYFGINAADAVACSVIFHLTQYIPITVIGLALLARGGISLRSLKMKETGSVTP